jgi:hypothetical protein
LRPSRDFSDPRGAWHFPLSDVGTGREICTALFGLPTRNWYEGVDHGVALRTGLITSLMMAPNSTVTGHRIGAKIVSTQEWQRVEDSYGTPEHEKK